MVILGNDINLSQSSGLVSLGNHFIIYLQMSRKMWMIWLGHCTALHSEYCNQEDSAWEGTICFHIFGGDRVGACDGKISWCNVYAIRFCGQRPNGLRFVDQCNDNQTMLDHNLEFREVIATLQCDFLVWHLDALLYPKAHELIINGGS